MTMRRGIYIVPTNRWYVERATWLVAGCVLLTSTALAALMQPYWVLLVIATGIASIAVGFTGYCVVGNILYRLGLPPMLAEETTPRAKHYIIRTDSWYLERRIYVAVGINISIASVLSIVYSPWWLTFTGFVGVAMLWFAGTGFCIMANGLYWIGAEPRLAPSCSAPERTNSTDPRPVAL